MIHVEVGDQKSVDVVEEVRRGRVHHPARVQEPCAKKGVGKEPEAAELDEHGGVADEGHGVRTHT